MNNRQAGQRGRDRLTYRVKLGLRGVLCLSVLLGCPQPKVPELPLACVDQKRMQTPLAFLALQAISQYGRLDPALFTVEQSVSPRIAFSPGSELRAGDNQGFGDALDKVNEDRAVVDVFIQKLQKAASSCGSECRDAAYSLAVTSNTPAKMKSAFYQVVVKEGPVPSRVELERFVKLFNHGVEGCPLSPQLEMVQGSSAPPGASKPPETGLGKLSQPHSAGTPIIDVFAGVDCDENVSHCDGCRLPGGSFGAYHPSRRGQQCCGASCPCHVHLQ
jgi:hypothetical protein